MINLNTFYKCCTNGSEIKYFGDGVKLCYCDTFLVRGSRGAVVAFHRCHIPGAACRQRSCSTESKPVLCLGLVGSLPLG